MAEELATYDAIETVLMLGKSGSQPVFVTDAADIRIRGGNRLDPQQPAAGNKGRTKFCGQKLSGIQCEWRILPEEEQHFWDKVFPLIKETGKNATANPLDIVNRSVNRAGVATVTVQDYEIGRPDPIDGREVSIELVEWSPAPVAPKKQTAAKAPVTPPTLPPATVQSNTMGGAR